jgi:polyisoprenoid-binding protein YceI
MQTITESTTQTWTIDPAHTLVEFSTKHMMITTVKGRFADVAGTITIDELEPSRSAAEVTLQAASISTSNEMRDEHLRSADFFDVENFPTLSFRSRRVTGAARKAGDRIELVGDLTIRGVTREVTVEATFEGIGRDPWGGDRISFSADTKLDRRDFGLTWNAALETGGVLVANDIKVSIEVQATRTD